MQQDERDDIRKIIAKLSEEWGTPSENVEKFFALAGQLKNLGARYASFREYKSDKSDNTETANHTVILNFSYKNMLADERKRLAEFDVNAVDVNDYDHIFEGVDYESQGYDLASFKEAVREALPTALAEINKPKEGGKTSNDIWVVDGIIVFNVNTGRLSVVGESVRKDVTEEGDYRKVKSAPKTVAKTIIRKQAGCRSDKYRRFALDNFNEARLQGETVEF